MDEAQRKLLEQGVIVLPEEIEHSTYEMMLEALLIHPEEIRLYCRGNGGNSDAAIAIVDLMAEHGHLIGLLPGQASSSHAIIFVGCQRRYVYPHGCIGLHKVAWDGLSTRVDSTMLRLMAKNYERTERLNAEILAGASNMPAGYWYDIFQDTGSAGVFQLDAKRLIELEIARPIEELTDETREDRSNARIGAQNGATRARA